MGNILNNLLNSIHLVGGRGAHGLNPFAVPVQTVLCNGPFQGLHRWNAGSMLCQGPKSHQIFRCAGNRKIREVFAERIIPGEFSFRLQNGNGQCSDGFGHGSNAKNGIFINRIVLRNAAKAICLF